jgi:hypothetical protein
MEISATSCIVITSIFEPTEAVKAFAALPGYQLLVVGDLKTPEAWACEGADYFSPAAQRATGYQLASLLPNNHYARKMMGYLKAMEMGASVIIDTDDDNIPKHQWYFPPLEGAFDTLFEDEGYVNIYQLFTNQFIWPRGLPLWLITKNFELEKKLRKQYHSVGIWQGLADEDPDVDAIYRLTSNTPCYFRERPPVVLGKGTICPFNTQNTLIRRELFALLYLPTYVTFRFTDILRGLVAQPIMWLYGYKLGFTNATVVQKRNPHDYMKDFQSEIPMYQSGETITEMVTAAIKENETIETNLLLAYEALHAKNIVCEKEIVTLKAWLADIATIKAR